MTCLERTCPFSLCIRSIYFAWINLELASIVSSFHDSSFHWKRIVFPPIRCLRFGLSSRRQTSNPRSWTKYVILQESVFNFNVRFIIKGDRSNGCFTFSNIIIVHLSNQTRKKNVSACIIFFYLLFSNHLGGTHLFNWNYPFKEAFPHTSTQFFFGFELVRERKLTPWRMETCQSLLYNIFTFEKI